MKIYQNKDITILFGDKEYACDPDDIRGISSEDIMGKSPLDGLLKELPLKKLFLTHQVHGVEGISIDTQTLSIPTFVYESDYVVTLLSQIGIGVVTADCLPIVLHDPVKKIVAVAHAGWRGLVGGIIPKMITNLVETYGVNVADLQVFFGPAAGVCCYEVKDDFLENEKQVPELKKLLSRKNNEWKFDSVGLAVLQCIESGILESKLIKNYFQCTICNDTFCSYRRDGGSKLRQFTIVSLK